MNERAEVVVVGLGPGGEEVAGRLAEAGLDVVGVDGRLVGGECPYWGCVPSKMMIRGAELLAEARRVPGMAGDVTVRPDYEPVASRIRDEATDNWDDAVAVKRFEDKGGRFVRGWGRLEGDGLVAVGERRIEATKAIVIGVGTEPVIPPIDGLASTSYWTNREAIEAPAVPSSLLVLGGGAVGVELAQVFARFGSSVHIVEAAERLLVGEEDEASAVVAKALGRDGIVISTGVTVRRIQMKDGFHLELQDGEVLRAERLLVAAGRRSDLDRLGVARLGLDPTARSLAVDDHLRVREGVWAVGDVTGAGNFTHVAMYQAAIVVDDILGRPVVPADYRALPRVTFTDPEVGSVGLSEAAARSKGHNVRIGMSDLASSTRGWIHKAGNEGFIKLVADADEGILLGATSVGPEGGEVLGFLVLAVHARVPVATLAHMLYAYPTFHRAIESAVLDLES